MSWMQIDSVKDLVFNGIMTKDTNDSRKYRLDYRQSMSNVYNLHFQDLLAQDFRAPKYTVDSIEAFYPVSDRQNVTILDVGAGTGILGQKVICVMTSYENRPSGIGDQLNSRSAH